jgi:CBS domain-containing protein
MLVRDFMHSPAVTCESDATLRDVAGQMHLRNVGCVVVSDADSHPCGIVTDRDIALKGLGEDKSAATQVAEIMTKALVTIKEDADVFDAAKKMSYAAVRRVPVVDRVGTVCGVIALDDITDALTKEIGLLREAVATQLSGGPGWDA